jgi:effector-binding domain-containing protein
MDLKNTFPKLEQRREQSYVAIRAHATRADLSTKLPPLIGELAGWLAARGVKPMGAPFYRYLVIDQNEEFDIEVGLPVSSSLQGDGRVDVGVIPAGCYAVTTHMGSYDNLQDATADLKKWAVDNDVQWDTSEDESRWGARLETYLTDPSDEPDPQKWQTEIAIRTSRS